MKQSLITILALIVAIAVTAVVTNYLTKVNIDVSADGREQTREQAEERKPLYWVAPMDSNYRREKPGKSPMGMDLIPVYEDSGSSANGQGSSSPGAIFISPEVVNNLGVRTATAERRPLHTEITTVGYVQYDEDQLVHIHPRVEGWIEKLYIKATGDPVTKGEPLYSLYSPQLVNAQEELLLALNRDNPRLIRAAENRLQALQIDPAEIRDLKRSREVKQTLTFYVPQSGVVDNLNIREGFFVKPGTTLMSVGTLTNVWVEAEILERQAALVAAGLSVRMTLDYLPGREWRGEVDYVYPSLDSKTRTLRVRLRFDNPDALLKPNMYARILIEVNEDAAVLAVPRDAVIRTGTQDRVVLSLGDGRFKSVAVKLGRATPEYTEILSGLAEGEQVVTSAQFLLDSESSKTSDFKRLHHGDQDSADGRDAQGDDHSGHSNHSQGNSHD